MEFSWTSFVLEIINFFILLWVLQKLFYKPIKRAILERKEKVQKLFDDATKDKKEAEELQKKYENRLLDWEKEREEKMLQLQHEMQDERHKKQQQLEEALKKEREKSQAQDQHRIDDLISKKEKEIISNGLKFTAILFKQLADSNLENKIFELFIKNISTLSPEKVEALKKEIKDDKVYLSVKSAFALTDENKNKIISSVREILGKDNVISDFKIDPELIAGFLMSIGSMVFEANLSNELKSFAEIKLNE